MAKNQISVYISETSRNWIEKFAPKDTKSGSVGFVADWAIEQVRRGAMAAYQNLETDERIAVISSMSGYLPDTSTSSLVPRTTDWFLMDAGAMLGWPQKKIDALIFKLGSLDPLQTMGLICWALGYWSKTEDVEVETYAEDFSALIA